MANESVQAITLNEQQQRALDRMVQFVGDDKWAFTLQGYAGTGKTTTIQQLFPRLTGERVCFTAPTHKAVKVLAGMARRANLDVVTSTIHSLLGLKVSREYEAEKIKEGGKSSIDKFDVVVVDECSMVGKELFRYIRRASEIYRVKFIFMGDPAQLPPVGEDRSETLAIEGATLTQVMRQRAEHPILGLCTDIRDAQESGMIQLPRVKPACSEDGTIGLHVMAGGYFEEYMPFAFSHENFNGNPDRFRILAYRNKVVEGYNRKIQEFRYPGLETPFADGEPVVFSSAAMRRVQVGMEKDWSDEILVSTECEGTVSGTLEASQHPELPQVKAWIVPVELETGVKLHVWTLDRFGQIVHERVCKTLADKARAKEGDWFTFWRMKDAFAALRPAYAMTTHKSQGSTFENVFVDVLDIWSNRNKSEALQCLYVACSRASHHLILNAGG
jgi:hypothetical protein